MTDVTDLMAEDHSRILRLFAALDDLARHRDHPRNAGLGDLWDHLTDLLELHLQTEEEICYPAVFPVAAQDDVLRGLPADDEDIREALAEARLHECGTIAWWQAVTDARAAARRHIQAGPWHLMPLLSRAGPQRRAALGQQWAAYTTARRRDAAADGQHPGTIT